MIDQAECVSLTNDNCEIPNVNVCQAECVRNTKKETAKDAIKPKQKVWTRLDNGLFAWRVKKTGKKTRGETSKNTLGEQAPQSASAKLKWEPVILKGDNIK